MIWENSGVTLATLTKYLWTDTSSSKVVIRQKRFWTLAWHHFGNYGLYPLLLPYIFPLAAIVEQVTTTNPNTSTTNSYIQKARIYIALYLVHCIVIKLRERFHPGISSHNYCVGFGKILDGLLSAQVIILVHECMTSSVFKLRQSSVKRLTILIIVDWQYYVCYWLCDDTFSLSLQAKYTVQSFNSSRIDHGAFPFRICTPHCHQSWSRCFSFLPVIQLVINSNTIHPHHDLDHGAFPFHLHLIITNSLTRFNPPSTLILI